ncbi:MAG TPA: hypothetical protein DCS24_04890, partial [Erythrobacter sp.]|nr:hypothetical protein [Erythrobacter sp.]
MVLFPNYGMGSDPKQLAVLGLLCVWFFALAVRHVLLSKGSLPAMSSGSLWPEYVGWISAVGILCTYGVLSEGSTEPLWALPLAGAAAGFLAV